MKILENRQEIEVPRVAQELGYTVRTVYRDLQVLERVGVPIYQDRRGRRARWRVVDGYRRRLSLTLSWADLVALQVGRKLLASGPFGDGANDALDKIREAVPADLGARAAGVEEKLSGSLGAVHDAPAQSGALQLLLEAAERNDTVEFEYTSFGSRTGKARRVDPYVVHVQGGAVYLIGFCHRRRALRTFLLDRLKDARRTGARFASRVPFAPESLLQGALGPWEGKAHRVDLQFGAAVASIVAERRIHPSQQMQWRSDGGLDVRLRVPLCPALYAWVLGWAADVRVVSPERLARHIDRRHERAVSRE
jgi:predicted DNA-binding transcriptional regulator YafY